MMNMKSYSRRRTLLHLGKESRLLGVRVRSPPHWPCSGSLDTFFCWFWLRWRWSNQGKEKDQRRKGSWCCQVPQIDTHRLSAGMFFIDGPSMFDWTVNPHSLHKATRASSEFSQKAGVWGQGFSLQSQSVEFRLGLPESRRPGSSDRQAGSGEARVENGHPAGVLWCYE